MSGSYCGIDGCDCTSKKDRLPGGCAVHNYERLNDTTIFCTYCGDVVEVVGDRVVPVCTLPHYPCTRQHYDYYWTINTNTKTFR